MYGSQSPYSETSAAHQAHAVVDGYGSPNPPRVALSQTAVSEPPVVSPLQEPSSMVEEYLVEEG